MAKRRSRWKIRIRSCAVPLEIELRSASVEEAALGRIHGAMVGALGLMSALPLSLAAQRRVPDQTAIDAYHATVARAFSVSPDEVGILSEWPLDPDEIVVVLFLARNVGVSPDAVRRSEARAFPGRAFCEPIPLVPVHCGSTSQRGPVWDPSKRRTVPFRRHREPPGAPSTFQIRQ